jgi:uroporphyrinogen III methyltransferase/synthase
LHRSPEKVVGKVYLVGAGPGDPGLMTLKGLEVLKRADLVIYDYLANDKLLDSVKPDAACIYAGKKGVGS